MRKGAVFLSLTSSADLKALDATAQKLRQVSKSAKATSSGFAGFGKGLAKIASVSAVIGVGTKAINEATEAFKTTAMTEQLLKNTGLAASVSAKQIGDLSMQISNLTGIDDEQVQAASNVLLGIKGLVPAGANAASTLANLTQVATDLGVKISKDPAAGARLLAKSLADPAKAVGALYRAGIPLDKQTADRVKALAKQGDLESARAIVLQNVASATQGLAAATADPLTKLATNLNNLLEVVGKPLLDTLAQITPSLSNAMAAAAPIFEAVSNAIAGTIGFLTQFKTEIFAVAVAVGVSVIALNAGRIGYFLFSKSVDLAAKAQRIFNLVMSANPLAKVVMVVSLLAAGFAILWNRSMTFRKIVAGAFIVVGKVAANIVSGILKGFALLIRGIKFVANNWLEIIGFIVKAAAKTFGNIPGIGDKLKEAANAFEGFKTGILDGLDTAANTVSGWGDSLYAAVDKASQAVSENILKSTKKTTKAVKDDITDLGKVKMPVIKAPGVGKKIKPKTAIKPTTARAAADQSFMVAGSGGGVSLSVTINGSVVQERDVARAIRDELLQFARRQGVSPQFGV